MTLKDRLDADMKTAMKAREAGKLRLSVIRMVRSAVKNAEIERRSELTDADILGILAKEVKLRREANETIPATERERRQDFIRQNKQEIAVLMEYLPEQMDEATIRKLVTTVIADVGAESPKEMGKVMAVLAPQVKGKADGRTVSRIVKEMLENE
ncbi:MAG: GatB/YqeY domain-containing protein [bacterium]|jgi:uncharacterized protein YqeY